MTSGWRISIPQTRQGFKGAFEIMGYAGHYHYADKEMARKLLANYVTVLPRTLAQVEAVRLSNLHRGLEATDDERKKKACALADGLHKRNQTGARLMEQEQAKNNRHLGELPFISLYMFCCGLAGACVRAMLTILCGTFGKFGGADFMRANGLYVNDHWFLKRMRPHAAELDQLFKELKFYDLALAQGFEALSKVLPTTRDGDTLVGQFVRGKALPTLFGHCVAVVGAVPVDGSIVAVTFSAEKTVNRPNASRKQTSHELQFQQNTVALLRSERALMIADSKSKGNHSTLAQVQKAGEQMLAAVKKYAPAHMSALSGRRTYHGCLKRTDVAQAEAAVAKKRTERAKKGTRRASTEAALRRRQLAFRSAPVKYETELEVIVAVTGDERQGAVVSEVKFKGQVGVATQFF